MRSVLACAFSFGLVVWAQTAEPPEVLRARQEAERIRLLVEAGALPRASLEQARQVLEGAEDEAILRRTLYGSISVEDLTEKQGEEMVAAAQRQVARCREKLDQAKKLVDAGAAPRTSLSSLLEELDRSRKTLDLAESRARLLDELAEIVRSENEVADAGLDTPPEDIIGVSHRYDGDGIFTAQHLRAMVLAFERKFDRPLPISARGVTALHRALRLDHRDRVDVALNPDQEEGVWLRRYLESAHIPYFAFRRAVPGSATAAHIHIGPPSNRLRAD